MKKKRTIPTAVMLAAGCMLCLSGCSVDLTTINEEDVPVETIAEEQNLAEGMIMIHMVWSDESGNSLSSAGVALYDGDSLLYSGDTADDGTMATCALPCNTTIVCSVTDKSGSLLAESEIVIKLSDDYSELSIYPVKYSELEDSLPQCVVEAPTDRTNVRAGVFVTGDGAVGFSSLTPYVEPEAEVDEPVSSDDAAPVTEQQAVEVEENIPAEEAPAPEDVTAIEIDEAAEAEETEQDDTEPEPEPEN